MHGISCDRCGEGLLLEEDVRYVLRIELFAAYDPLELTAEDLRKDFDAEYRRLLEAALERPVEELQNEVHFARAFDLCGRCQRAVLADPLFRGGDMPPGGDDV